MNKNAISPRRHTKPHEELMTIAKAIDKKANIEQGITNHEVQKTKEQPFAFPSAF
jgi:hypothetical protein